MSQLSLKKPRTWESFKKDRLEKMSDSIINSCVLAKSRFDEFLYAEYDRLDTDKFITHIKSLDEDTKDDELFAVIQSWIDWLTDTFDLNHGSTKQAFSRLNKYFRYNRIKITPGDIKEELEWPENIQEEKYAPTEDEFIQIITALNWKNRGYCLTLSSEGERPVEIMGTQKKHYTLVDGRFQIDIPYYLTKKRISRTVFASIEATPYIAKLLKERSDEEFVWTKRRQVPQSFLNKYSHLKKEKAIHKAIKRFATDYLASVRNSLNLVLSNSGLDMKYETTGEHKITLYSLRARFITRALRVLDGDIVHAIVGHGAYLQTYQRRTDEEKLELFLEVEPSIMIFDQTKNTEKIRKLKEANKKVDDLQNSLQEEKEARLESEKQNKQSLAKLREEILKNSSNSIQS